MVNKICYATIGCLITGIIIAIIFIVAGWLADKGKIK